MIEVIERKEVPTAEMTCPNCKSVLRYGNADLHEYYPQSNENVQYLTRVKHYALRCPVCGLSCNAAWINRKEKDDGGGNSSAEKERVR